MVVFGVVVVEKVRPPSLYFTQEVMSTSLQVETFVASYV